MRSAGLGEGTVIRMKLRELTYQGFSVWPPQWASSYGPGDRFALGDEGVLTGVRVNAKERHLMLTMRWEGRENVGVLQWDGPPDLKTVENLLKDQVGKSIRDVGNLDLG